uniref:CapA family protein n=1 Tax=Roseihalotalea indica TaxID=2867963 RepID=A0AA49JCF9_9BACT|nr:CapA family protein [Tunicatimonas sp. TK19036]
MSLVFVGDIAYPYDGAIDINQLKGYFNNSTLIGNLEGPIIDTPTIEKAVKPHNYNLYSTNEVISLLNEVGVASVSVANNHFCDFETEHNKTLTSLQNSQIDYFGITDKRWSTIKVSGVDCAFYGTYTFITGGNKGKHCPLNEFHSERAIQEIASFKRAHPDTFITVFIHWGYELAAYPQPADREWARKIIDLGADAVVGHHPHVVQGVEYYKDGIIAYSLGNFVLPQVNYLDKKLKYSSPKVLEELALEISPDKKGKAKLHFFRYDLAANRVDAENLNQEQINSRVAELTPFQGLSDKEYQAWFKRHQQKSRYPTYSSYNDKTNVRVNNSYIKLLKLVRKILINTNIRNPYQ